LRHLLELVLRLLILRDEPVVFVELRLPLLLGVAACREAKRQGGDETDAKKMAHEARIGSKGAGQPQALDAASLASGARAVRSFAGLAHRITLIPGDGIG